MDISPEYVKMCLKAEEIQKGAIRDEDYIVVTDGSNLRIYEGLAGLHKYPFHSPSPVTVTRIFRQDQLQILSNLSWKAFDAECQKYNVDTKEQAGICVVMNCRFKKKWQNDEWKLDKCFN